MKPEDFDRVFEEISKVFTLDLIAKKLDIKGEFPKRNPKEPLWDCIEDLHHEEYIDIGEGRLVSCRYFFKRPVRTLFFILISELESRLFRIDERTGKDVEELNNKTLKELIIDLVETDLFELQEQYSSKRKLKEDLKAMSLFRNVIVHTNKRLEKSIEPDTIAKRKEQILKLLDALQQISDRMPRKDKQ